MNDDQNPDAMREPDRESLLQTIIDYVVGRSDSETAERTRERLRDPASSESCMLNAVQFVGENAFAPLGRTATAGGRRRGVSPRPDRPATSEGDARLKKCGLVRRIKRILHGKVAILAERYRATSGSLFVLEGDQLSATVTHNTDWKRYHMRVSGNGVVPHVARFPHEIHCYGNVVEECLFYERRNPDTKSEWAVPIFAPGGKRLCGVLNLESTQEHAFPKGGDNDLRKDVTSMVGDLLSLEGIRSGWVWHPDLHGWHPLAFLSRICRSLAKTVHRDSAASTVWYADRAKGRLFVLGTHGCHYVYLARNHLQTDSFVGDVTLRPAGHGSFSHLDGFRRGQEAGELGLKKMYGFPVHLPGNEGDPAFGALTVSLFNQAPKQAVPSFHKMAKVAELVGQRVALFQALREEIACAFLEHQLHAQGEFWPFEAIKHTLLTCLSANACSVFYLDETLDKLVGVTTSGISFEQPGADGKYVIVEMDSKNPVVYDMKSDRGIMTYLAEHPGACIRKHSMLDTGEGGVPGDLPNPDCNKHCEVLDGDATDSRFLGLSLRCGSTTLVFRAVRSSKGVPFMESDERLLRTVTEFWKSQMAGRKPEGVRLELRPTSPRPTRESYRSQNQWAPLEPPRKQRDPYLLMYVDGVGFNA